MLSRQTQAALDLLHVADLSPLDHLRQWLPGQAQDMPQRVLEAAQAQVQALAEAGVRGLVVAGTGNGTTHQALDAALDVAQSQGLAVRRSTRCERGRIVQAEGADDSRVSALPAVKARTSLMLELMGWPRTDR